MNTGTARRMVELWLKDKNIKGCKLRARTFDFQDARGTSIFVDVSGWTPRPEWDELKEYGKSRGFIVSLLY